jgi:hypothetical protein
MFNIFRAQSNFLTMVKNKILTYEFTSLNSIKNLCTHSNNIKHHQKKIEQGQKVCELADGLGLPNNNSDIFS